MVSVVRILFLSVALPTTLGETSCQAGEECASKIDAEGGPSLVLLQKGFAMNYDNHIEQDSAPGSNDMPPTGSAPGTSGSNPPPPAGGACPFKCESIKEKAQADFDDCMDRMAEKGRPAAHHQCMDEAASKLTVAEPFLTADIEECKIKCPAGSGSWQRQRGSGGNDMPPTGSAPGTKTCDSQMHEVAGLNGGCDCMAGFERLAGMTTGACTTKMPKLQRPSSELYNLAAGTNASTYSQMGQDTMLLPILQQLGSGFFVESGAFDGETGSNTLYYELKLGWRGLLVEPSPDTFSKLLGKHRRAHAYQGCLSTSDHAETFQFSVETEGPETRVFSVPTEGRAGMIDGDGHYAVEAQPLHALMEQAGESSVDFWSLDVEGSESHVLQSTDFSKVEVGVLLIEMNKSEENNRGIYEVMKKEGFHNIGHSIFDKVKGSGKRDGILDQVFVNPKYFQKRGLLVPTSGLLAPQYRN